MTKLQTSTHTFVPSTHTFVHSYKRSQNGELPRFRSLLICPPKTKSLPLTSPKHEKTVYGDGTSRAAILQNYIPFHNCGFSAAAWIFQSETVPYWLCPQVIMCVKNVEIVENICFIKFSINYAHCSKQTLEE